MFQWLRSWRQWRDERILNKRAIPERLWIATLAAYPFLRQRPSEHLDTLRRLATLFLARKEFAGANGFTVTDRVAVAVAAQACLPILRLGLNAYDGFVGIVIQPGEVLARREVADETGVVHAYDEVLSGETMEGGPVMLSWPDVAEAGASAEFGYNVVIHEFVHKLDLLDGAADGVPLLPSRAARARWLAVMRPAYDEFCRRVDRGDATFLDPYGAEGIEEFFAVAAEAFFVAPQDLQREHGELYRLFCAYFRQDPAADLTA